MMIRIFLSVVALMALLPAAYAQGQEITISGTVKTPQGAAIADALVLLVRGDEVKRATTDASGVFTVTAPGSGQYEMEVRSPLPGYAPQTRTVTLPADRRVDFVLEPADQGGRDADPGVAVSTRISGWGQLGLSYTTASFLGMKLTVPTLTSQGSFSAGFERATPGGSFFVTSNQWDPNKNTPLQFPPMTGKR